MQNGLFRTSKRPIPHLKTAYIAPQLHQKGVRNTPKRGATQGVLPRKGMKTYAVKAWKGTTIFYFAKKKVRFFKKIFNTHEGKKAKKYGSRAAQSTTHDP